MAEGVGVAVMVAVLVGWGVCVETAVVTAGGFKLVASGVCVVVTFVCWVMEEPTGVDGVSMPSSNCPQLVSKSTLPNMTVI